MKKYLKHLLAVAIVALAVLGVFAPRAMAANGEYNKPECEGIFQDLTCTSLDHAAAFLSLAYETFSDNFLEIDPATFDYQYIGSPGHALHSAWDSVRIVANIAFAILMIFVVLSQITGIGISNYGVKKMLPRLVAGVLMVNLSYIICQGAIDLANIFGTGLGSMFEDLMIDSMPPEIGFNSSTTALTSLLLGAVSAFVIYAKGLGSKVIMLAILGILAIVLAVFILFVIAVVRQALCILLVVFSPIAFVCYMMPGSKGIFNKWFSMFKGVLLAYPICSLMVYGGSYAGAVIYGTWTDNDDYGEILRNLSFLLIATVPYFFIPGVIMKSLGAAESAVAKLNSFVQKNGRGALGRTRFMTDMKRRADQDQQLARAGYRRTLDGKIVQKWRPKEIAENSNDGTVKKAGKRAINTLVRGSNRAEAWLAAPYIKNKVRIEAEERRANAYRTSLKRMEDKELSNYYIFDPTANNGSGEFKKVTVPLTNRQLRKGMIKDQKIYRVKDGVKNPSFALGSTDLEHITNGELKRVKKTIRSNKEKTQIKRGNDVAAQARNQEIAAWAGQIKNSNLGVEQISDAIHEMTKDPKAINSAQLSAYTSALVSNGMAGRDELENLISGDAQLNVDAIKTLANGLTASEMNSIKKKNPILHNKLTAIREDENGTLNVGDLSIDKKFEITEKQIDGLSPKHIAEMDKSAQKRVVNSLLAAVESDPNEINKSITVKAVGLAEGALNDPEIRAMMSPEQVQDLEHIVGVRRAAVEAESAKTMRSDRAAMKSASSYSNVATENIGDEFRKDFKNKFLKESEHPGGNEGVLGAIMHGSDTARVEAITKAANAQLDEILRDASRGLSSAQIKAARDDIMRGLIEDIDRTIAGKKKSLLTAMEQQEQANGTSADEIKTKKAEMQKQLNDQFGGATALCDVLIQRINMRSQ